MKVNMTLKIYIIIINAFLSCASLVVAQPAAAPLDVQGLNQFSITGMRSRAMGGTTTANVNDASALFSNPAALSLLSSFEIRAGGLFGTAKQHQTQEWVPSKQLPGLSVLFEGLSHSITMPADTTLGPWETVQRQYDDIKPNWVRHSSGVQLLSLVAAIPYTFAGIDMTAGLGVSQVIDLDNYYQNNNSLSPYLGQLRGGPSPVPFGADTLHVKWYQYKRMREGSVYGIIPGISIKLFNELSIGASATVLTGSSDDNEHRLERGHLNIAIENSTPVNFLLDTVYYTQSKVGTSSYRGNIFNFGLHFQQERFSIGITVRPPMKLTRTWKRVVTSTDLTIKPFPVRIDSLGERSYQENGKDYLELPLSYSVGIMLTPTNRWTIAFDFERRQLSKVSFTSTSASLVSRPWVNDKGAMRLGVEYNVSDILALRGGYREDIKAFSPDGSAIIDEPASGGIYSFGTGITIDKILIDLAYEYAHLKYQDMYQSNVNYNAAEYHSLMLEVAYRF